MKIIIFGFFCIFGASFAQAETMERYAGTYTKYNKWTEKDVYTCYVAVKKNDGGYEVRISYGSKDLAALEKMVFAFNKNEIKHPATDQSYDDVPVNFSSDQFYGYSRIPDLGTLRISLVGTSDNLQVNLSEGFYFVAETNKFTETNSHCVNLKKLNSY